MLNKTNQKYSFPKNDRFKIEKKEYDDVFYNIPQKKEERSSSLGYGQKVAFGNQKSITPGPGTYNYSQVIKNTGQSIGLGREQIAINSYIPKKQSDIGPGQFLQPSTNNKKSYSIRGRVQEIDKMNYIPGPGYYPQQSTINRKHSLSKIENSQSQLFNPPTSQRFSYQEKKIPGPGQYDLVESQDRSKGSYCLSNLKSTQGQSIGKKQREFFKTKNDVPGPGAYKSQSFF